MKATTSNALKERCLSATIKFLENRGYEILDSSPAQPEVALVAKDGETVVFFELACREGFQKGFSESHSSRACMESAAACWLAESKQEDECFRCRFDRVSVMVLSPTRAFLRHHINALQQAD